MVRGCVELLRGEPAEGERRQLAMMLGNQTDDGWLDGGKPPGHAYWARVWAARALLYVWDDLAGPALRPAMADEQWRVREMAAKVVAARETAAVADAVAALTDDETPRVRAAAARALGVVGEGEHADRLLDLLDDPEALVVRAADRALRVLSRRLDRDFR